MRRFCAFAGVLCLMLLGVALRLYFCRLDLIIEGTYTAFSDNDEQIYTSISKGYERVDVGNGTNASEIIRKLKARIIKTEKVGDITIIYAYSPCLLKSVRLFDENVNVMIATTPSSVVVGSPLIKGGY